MPRRCMRESNVVRFTPALQPRLSVQQRCRKFRVVREEWIRGRFPGNQKTMDSAVGAEAGDAAGAANKDILDGCVPRLGRLILYFIHWQVQHVTACQDDCAFNDVFHLRTLPGHGHLDEARVYFKGMLSICRFMRCAYFCVKKFTSKGISWTLT